MTITDADRSDLYQYLKEHMGEERANTVMALVPPVGWGDMATKQDLAHESATIRLEMKAEFAKVRTEMADLRTELRTELHKTLRSHTLFLVGTNITLFGLAVATVRLAG